MAARDALEVLANALNAASILLAGSNSIHTWWTGIAGCALFAWVFSDARLYADVTLQLLFIITSIAGWKRWSQLGDAPPQHHQLCKRRATRSSCPSTLKHSTSESAWILVNTIAVPLYASRGLYLTAALYLCFWVNAWVSLGRWRRLAAPAAGGVASA